LEEGWISSEIGETSLYCFSDGMVIAYADAEKEAEKQVEMGLRLIGRSLGRFR
jgi:hypothetical protein